MLRGQWIEQYQPPLQRSMLHVPLSNRDKLRYYDEPTSRKYIVATVTKQNGVSTMKYIFFILTVTSLLQGMESEISQKNATIVPSAELYKKIRELTEPQIERVWKRLPEEIHSLQTQEPDAAFYHVSCPHCKATLKSPYNAKSKHTSTCASKDKDEVNEVAPTITYEGTAQCPYIMCHIGNGEICEATFTRTDKTLGLIIRMRESMRIHIKKYHPGAPLTQASYDQLNQYIFYRQYAQKSTTDKTPQPKKRKRRSTALLEKELNKITSPNKE